MTQDHLFPIPSREPTPVLLLSIQPPHAERIFKGEKQFELRKSLPNRRFSRVYLYQSGGRGVVGCFDAGSVIKKPIHQLWESVGEQATTRERFDAYFDGWERGCAIEVRSPVEFDKPILPPALKEAIPKFTAPQSFLLLQPGDALYEMLEAKRKDHLGNRPIRLDRISPSEHASFTSVVTSEISRNYDEITSDFAASLLKMDALGEDPTGIFTTRKEVFSAFEPTLGLIGFTTLTYKLGGSAKTGPTILFPEYRGKGFGTSLRREVIRYAKSRGVRKLYCTCPETEIPVIRHLLGNGLMVEAHLAGHYRLGHGEIVFGMLLNTTSHGFVAPPPRTLRSAEVCEPEALPEDSLVDTVHRLLNESGYPVSLIKANMLVHRAKRDIDQPYEDKPLEMACLVSGSECIGLLIMIPKRGGATKGIIVSATSDGESLAKLLDEAETRQRTRQRRKLYFAHPLTDHEAIQFLLRSQYRPEGILKQPYTPGLDAIVLSKQL